MPAIRFGRFMLRIILGSACLLLASALLPALAQAEGVPLQAVRVGIVEQEGYSQFDADGTVRGRDAEYLARIAQYALFDLQYRAFDSFDGLLAALENGEIDLTPGISKSEEREAKFLFSENEMANGYVTIKVYSDDESYEYGNLIQIEGMKLGYVSGSSVAATVSSWARDAGLAVRLTAYPSEHELRGALTGREIDGVLSTGNLMTDCRTILSIKSQSYYVAINRDRNDLKLLIDSAINRILEEMPMYAANLFYNQETRKQNASIILTAEQKEYLLAHTDAPVRIAVIGNDPPFNTTQNGECRGIIRDYYDQTAALLQEIVPGFSVSYVSFPSFEAAVKAVMEGEADVLGMARLSAVEASRYGLILSGSLESVSMMRLSLSASELSGRAVTRAAVLSSDLETIRFLMGPDRGAYQWVTVQTPEEANRALERGEADVILLSLPHATWLTNQERSGSFYLMTLPYTGWELTCAVNRWNAEWGVILSKAARSNAVDITAVISKNTVTESGLRAFLHRLPLRYVVGFFASLTLVLLFVFFLVIRTRHLRSLQRENDALIRSQKELLHAYEYDALTGLANRNTAIRRATERLRASDRFCMVLMSVNNLGFVNESFGYEQGDKVVRQLSERLLEYVRQAPEERYVCRYSGDEFLLLLSGIGVSTSETAVSALRAIGSRAVHLSGNEDTSSGTISVWPHVTFGIAGADGVSSPEQIIQNCAIAANAAREEGTEAARVYAEDLKTALSRRNVIRDELIHALEHDGFTMVYQPKIDLKTGAMLGLEALVRMKNNKFSPGAFIPVAEDSGYIQRIGRLTACLVVRQLAQWKKQGLPVYPVSINYSSNQLGDAEFVDFLLRLLREYDVSPALMEIEVTETLLMKQGAASEELFRQLHAAGIRLSLDDFGSGYSSLHYLSFIPVDVIKLDKSIADDFLREEPDEPGKNDFVRDLIHLLHNLGKKVIIEGIEEAWQVKKLVSYGCDGIQGFYFSRPLPPGAIASFALTEEQRRTLG